MVQNSSIQITCWGALWCIPSFLCDQLDWRPVSSATVPSGRSSYVKTRVMYGKLCTKLSFWIKSQRPIAGCFFVWISVETYGNDKLDYLKSLCDEIPSKIL